MRFSLRVTTGKHAGREIAIRGRQFIIGCADNCHLQVRDSQVRPFHCALLMQDGEVWLRDFGGGVFVGGTRITDRRRLDPGDQLQIGSLHFELVIQDAPTLGNGRAPDEGDILDILSQSVERPAAPAAEFVDLRHAPAGSPQPAPRARTAPASRSETGETADLATDMLYKLHNVRGTFKAPVPAHASTAPSLSPPDDDEGESLSEGPLEEVSPGVSASSPRRRLIRLPRWLFTADGQLDPNVMFVLGIWVGIGLSTAVVTLWRVFGFNYSS